MVKKLGKQLIADTAAPSDARGQADTIQVWELHRERALLWRAVALLQIPATFIIAVVALSIWNGRTITLNVPAQPLPGTYRAQQIPDAEFIAVATDFVNLIATYQPVVAKRQFEEASKYLSGEILTEFRTSMLGRELSAISQTDRTQIYWIDPLKTTLTRRPGANQVIVEIFGERSKIVASEEMPVKRTHYTITLTTVPRNPINPFGIVIVNVVTSSDKKEIAVNKSEAKPAPQPAETAAPQAVKSPAAAGSPAAPAQPARDNK